MQGKRIRSIEDSESEGNLKWFLVDDTDESEFEGDSKGDSLFICGIDGCKAEFTSETQYDKHYELFHHYICSVCKKRLLNDQLLTMHVLEEHDHLFKIMSQRQPMYQCFVRTCKQKYDTKEERRLHAIKDHFFPENSPIFDNGIEQKSKMVEEANDIMQICKELEKLHIPSNVHFGDDSVCFPSKSAG